MVHLRVEFLVELLIMEPLVAASVLLGWWQETDLWDPPVHPFTWSLRRVGLKFKRGVPCGHLHWVSCSSQELELWSRIEVSAKVWQFSICLPSTIFCSCKPHLSNTSLWYAKINSTHDEFINIQRLYVSTWLSALRVFWLYNPFSHPVCFYGPIRVSVSKLWYLCWYFDPQSNFLLLSGVGALFEDWGISKGTRFFYLITFDNLM